jgi:hypothetical protein
VRSVQCVKLFYMFMHTTCTNDMTGLIDSE